MPEGDTVHKLARVLRTELVERAIVSSTIDGTAMHEWVGAEVDDVFAIGKHLFIVIGDRVLRTHLGMHGKWVRARSERSVGGRRAPSVTLSTTDVTFACLAAKEVELLDLRGQRFRAWKRRLGPDLSVEGVAVEAIPGRARSLLPSHAPIVDVLLDQRIASGIGNVYKSEALHLEHRSPREMLRAFADDELFALFHRAHRLLRSNLRGGPRRTRLPRPNHTALRDEDDSVLWVYGRGGEPCFRCESIIDYARMGAGNRGTWWCARCQPGRVE